MSRSSPSGNIDVVLKCLPVSHISVLLIIKAFSKMLGARAECFLFEDLAFHVHCLDVKSSTQFDSIL